MEFVGTEISRVIHLTQLHRAAGQTYLPEAVAKLGQRYSFAKIPSLDDLLRDTHTFQVGKFQDVQIADLSVYSDGLIVTGQCNTKILAAFVEDMLQWARAELGLTVSVAAKPETHFESSIIVKSNVDLSKIIAPKKVVSDLITTTIRQKTSQQFVPTGVIADCDQGTIKTKRRPAKFIIDRRVGFDFSDNLFFSQAPLQTDDHLDVLRALEALGE